jgi:hypothetical protein
MPPLLNRLSPKQTHPLMNRLQVSRHKVCISPRHLKRAVPKQRAALFSEDVCSGNASPGGPRRSHARSHGRFTAKRGPECFRRLAAQPKIHGGGRPPKEPDSE